MTNLEAEISCQNCGQSVHKVKTVGHFDIDKIVGVMLLVKNPVQHHFMTENACNVSFNVAAFWPIKFTLSL